ncbi:MAG TPA: GAF domain-containing protein [Vicinamibacterales bacterium]|nr:GAF domain-containing protein [Vicinamibacterales bacterium]
MFRRTVRIACLVVGLLVTAGLAYRTLQNEDALNREQRAATAGVAAVNKTAELLLDLRASLHAYVAPGQGLPFWGKRAQETIDQLRQSLVNLDGIVTPRGGSLAESLDAVDQLSAAEQRASTYASRDEMQLAGDVIFTEVRDLLAVATTQVQSVANSLTREHDRRAAAIRQEQLSLATAGVAIWIVIALLLLPTEPKPAVQDPAHWRNELKETLKRPIPVAPPAPTPAVIVAPEVPVAPDVLATLKTVAEICGDLSALSDPGALEGALARVSALLNATGLIVWVASNDGATLAPVATHGFDPKIVARIGKIGRDSSNLTAAAFRENQPRISAVTPTTPGALAVPMCSPTGPAGVLSIELKAGQPVDEPKVALAAIIAAQLATLAMPMAAPPERQAAVSTEAPPAKVESKSAAL